MEDQIDLAALYVDFSFDKHNPLGGRGFSLGDLKIRGESLFRSSDQRSSDHLLELEQLKERPCPHLVVGMPRSTLLP